MYRCLKLCGFSTFGDFLSDLLNDSVPRPRSLAHSVGAFVRGQGREGTRPVDIMKLLYSHPKARRLDGAVNVDMEFPSIPRHGRGPDERLVPELPKPSSALTSRNTMADWMVSEVLAIVDREGDRLTARDLGFFVDGALTWDSLLTFDIMEQQQAIAEAAPVSFAVLSTLATNKGARKRLEDKVLGLETNEMEGLDDPEEPTETPAGLPTANDSPGLESKLESVRRDPWLVSQYRAT